MRYVGDQITNSVRVDSRNEDFSSTTGINTENPLRYINYAQERLQSLVLNATPGVFQAEKIITSVANQEAYSVPDRVFASERILSVEWSPTGQVRDYYKLPERGINYRNTNSASDPAFYIRRTGQLLLNPITTKSSGSVRVVYERQMDTLATRAGTISATGASTLTLTGADTTSVYNVSNADYVCVSDKYGTVLLYNGAVSSWGSPTLTLSATVASYLVSGYSASDLVGAYVTVGKWTTTHSKLQDICERYLETYATRKMFIRDASESAARVDKELSEMEQDIVKTYQQAGKDDFDISISDSSLLINNVRSFW